MTRTAFATSKMPQPDSPPRSHQLRQFASHLTVLTYLSRDHHLQHRNTPCLGSLAQPPPHSLMSSQKEEQNGHDSSRTSQTDPPPFRNPPRPCNVQQYPEQPFAIRKSAFSTCSETC